jgi:hypothetical protein
MKNWLPVLMLATLLPLFSINAYSTQGTETKELFRDDFESGMDRWDVSDTNAIAIIESGNPEHGQLLRMTPAHASLYALIRGSETWDRYRIEGEVLFPDVAYFKTSIQVEGTSARLQFSSVDNLAIWVNGVFEGYLSRDRFAWFDFGKNPEHPQTKGSVPLSHGNNVVVIRVRGGQYATGGFYARVVY